MRVLKIQSKTLLNMLMVVKYLNFVFHIETKIKSNYKILNFVFQFLKNIKTWNGTLGTRIILNFRKYIQDIYNINMFFHKVFYKRIVFTHSYLMVWFPIQTIIDATIIHRIFETNSSFHVEKRHTGKVHFAIFLANIEKIFILAGRLGSSL